ncbi:hypothetical protein B0T24DRAFT_676340 [Lasiosphaeria ovina]|uniref:Uncharacterized protein n=1 Tax=Lasiosphaeria ovina TaxID=92902 RepID=A0AAE0NFM7_9PEZI|nr:hypothetical protein B0T24DRAFT_676340 [Lasiosphaeria ovina]
MAFEIGDVVRIRGQTYTYKVIAITNSLVTILIVNPQPDGTVLTFSPICLQSVDESRIEKVEDGG